MAPRKAGLGFILVTLFLDILGLGLVVPILPQLIKELSGGDTAVAAGWQGEFAAVYALMQLVCSPILGSLSDRVGRRPVLLLSMAGMGFNYLINAWAPTLGWLFLGRVIAGLTGASISTATAYIADVSPPEKRAQNFGLVGMAFGLGFIAGPALGAVLGPISLRLPFLVAAGMSLLGALYGTFVLPESLPKERRRTFSWSRANPVGTLSELKRTPVVLRLAAASFFVELAQRGLESVWVLYMGYRYHWSLMQTNVSLVLVGLTQALMQGFVVRRLVPAIGERRSILAGVAVAMFAFALYGLAPVGWMIYLIIPIGAFAGLAPPAANGLMSRAIPPDEQGMLQGALSSMRSLTMVLGPPIASHLFGYFISPAAPVALPGAPFFSGALFIMVGLVMAAQVLSRPDVPGAAVVVAADAPVSPSRAVGDLPEKLERHSG